MPSDAPDTVTDLSTPPLPRGAGPNGGGRMGALVRAFDWAATPLGPVAAWLPELRAAAQLALDSPMPSVVAWGPALTVIHNDAYRPLLGGKAEALGRPFRELWAEAADEIGPLLDRALRGEASFREGARFLLHRGAAPEEAWFDYGFSPLRDGTGAVAGVLNQAVETTARVLAERARSRSDRRLQEAVDAAGLSDDFRALFEAAPTPLVALAPPDWVIVAVNDARLKVTGTTREGTVGRRLFDAFPDDPDDPAADGVRNLSASLRRVLEARGPDAMAVQRYAIRDADDRFEERWWSAVNTPVPGADGEVALVLHRAEDVTELVRVRGRADASDRLARDQQEVIDRLRAAEAAGRSSEARYQALFQAIDVGFCIVELRFDAGDRAVDYRLAEMNPAFERQTGLAGAAGKWVSEVAPGLERHWFDTYGRVALTGEPTRFENRAEAFGRWYDVHAFRVGETGEHRVAVLFSDISERRRAEDELRRLNATLEAEVAQRTAERDRIWRLSQDMMGVADDRGVWLSVNPAWTRVLGWNEAELVGRTSEWLEHPDDREATRAEVSRLAAGDTTFRFENRFRTKAGGYAWLSWTATPEAGLLYCTGRDVTDQKNQAAALRLYGDIVQSDHSPVVAFDAHHRITAFNRAHHDVFLHVFGHRPAVGEMLPDLFPPDQAAVLRGLMDRALAGETFTTVKAFGDPGAVGTHFQVDYAPLRDEAGGIVGAFHRAKDITDRLAAEAELAAAQDALRQAQKMEAMGQLTGGVAHDFNNLLTPIMGSLDLLQRRGLGGERERRLIAGAIQSADRARVLVQRLLAFARRQPLQPVPVDLGRLVAGMAGLVASTAGPQVRVAVDAPGDLPPALADPNQVEMALLNLAVNARDAMPDGGALTVSARAETLARACDGLAPGGYLRLSVADTGAGMDEATLARAVEPFFSTKGVGKGTGLGLSMVHGLASQLGGALRIASRPGLGTTVDLWLPRAEATPKPAPAPPRPVRAPAPRGAALLVDDEDLVRISTADMLAELGYRVVEAASAEQALELVGRGQAFDLLITDHLMPGMTGADLARALRMARPDLPVLLVSGYAEGEGVDPALPRLTKPFREDELAASLARL